jgi:choline-sulfatase
MQERPFCTAIERVDHQVGLILDALEATDQADNTYIVLSSDHNESLGDHGLWGKHTAYEASMRVPLIAAGPGIEGGRVSDAMVELMDVNPTLCELAGLPQQESIDARSFAPILQGHAETHRDACVTMEHPYAAIRTPSHKFIDTLESDWELYGLREDPDERRNLAGEQPQLARELRGRLRHRMGEGKWRR